MVKKETTKKKTVKKNNLVKSNSKKKTSSKKKVILVLVLLITLLSLLISTSYAVWIFTKTQTNQNVLSTDCFDMTLTDSNEIRLNNTFPITESTAMNLTPYTFTITNTCGHTGSYEVNLETLNGSTLGLNYLKIKVDNNASQTLGSITNNTYTVLDNASSSKKILEGVITPGESTTHTLRIWLDENATQNQVENKTFKSKLTIKTVLNKVQRNVVVNLNGTKISEETVDSANLNNYQVQLPDISTATNVSCNNGAIPSISQSTLTISKIHEDTTCNINDSIATTITNLDNTLTNIVMLKDENNVGRLIITDNGNVSLNLNGKKIESVGVGVDDTTYVQNHQIVSNNGYLIINDENNSGGIYTGAGGACIVNDGGTVIINGGNFDGRNAVLSRGNNSEVVINNGNFKSSVYASVSIDGSAATNLTINNANFENNKTMSAIGSSNTNSQSTITINNVNINVEGSAINNSTSSSSKIVINGGVFLSKSADTILNKKDGIIDINGGTFISNTQNVISNNSTGAININGGDYSTTSSNSYAISNISSGIINISNSKITSIMSTIFNSSGIININDNNYITCTRTSTGSGTIWQGNGNGKININGTPATFDANGNYLSGLYINSVSSSSIISAGGEININGGTYKSSYRTINVYTNNSGVINIMGNTYIEGNGTVTPVISQGNGTINIKGNNAMFDQNNNYISGLYIYSSGSGVGIGNTGTGNINICGGTIKSTSKNFKNDSTGYIYYSSSTSLSNGLVADVNDPTHVILNNSLSCSSN